MIDAPDLLVAPVLEPLDTRTVTGVKRMRERRICVGACNMSERLHGRSEAVVVRWVSSVQAAAH